MRKASTTTRLRLCTSAAKTGEASVHLLWLTQGITMMNMNMNTCDSSFRAKVGELLPQVSSSKIHLQYAKAKEADGK